MKHALRLAASLLMLTAMPAFAAWDLPQLMTELARNQGGRAHFTERKYIALLDKPVISSGEMRYLAPDYLEKRTITPRLEVMTLDKDEISLERGKQKITLRLREQPEVLAFVASIRGTLSGNRVALEQNYALHLSGQRDNWTLNLSPSNPRIAELVTRITITGSQHQVRSIEYLQADGDRSIMSIEPMDAAR
ncbi:LolA-related protein [Zoogloea sp.]|uniref:LolA-related protein n=1 Tax=Zoogloea sp. TaxID=49181 RepID=UPI002C9F1B84|nr:outer membrane lipoprotein carrier protein LolA [Zoogloea sp.]